MRFQSILAAGMLIVLTACQTPNSGPLPSQDMTINASKVQTKEALIKAFMPYNYRIVRDSDFQLVLDRPANDNFAAMMLAGSRFNGVPNARVTFTITGDNPTQVSSRLELVTNPGSGFEQAMDLNSNADGRRAVATGLLNAKTIAETSR